MKRENYAAAMKLIAASKRILVSGHLSPDGDSLGSMIALARLLRRAGHEAFATADVNALGKPGFLEGVADLIPVRKLKRQKKFDLFEGWEAVDILLPGGWKNAVSDAIDQLSGYDVDLTDYAKN